MAVKGAAIRAVITGGAGRTSPHPADTTDDAGDAEVAGAAGHEGEGEGFADELKPGTALFHGQYTIVGFLNSGGFGITYLAKDSLDRTVVIKECFPGTLCRRSNTIVRARSRAHQSDFRSVVRLFVQEARNLSKLVHPNIVGVHQVFEDNDTAYMVIDFIRGRDLLDLLEDETHRFTPGQVVRYLRKMLEAVRFVHDTGMLHRDISPDNILIDDRDEPILIDFGAAREQATRQSRALSTLRVVKDGYSPQEFYIAGSVQNESSDLYALAATFYHVISGSPPPDSQRRLAEIAEGEPDPYVPLAGRFPGYPPGFLEALDKAASVLPKDRLPTAEAWMRMIDGAGHAAPARSAAAVAGGNGPAAVRPHPAPDAGTPEPTKPAAPEAAPEAAAAPATPSPAARRRPWPVVLLGSAAAVLAAAGYALFLRAPEATDPAIRAPAPEASREAAVLPAPRPAVGLGPTAAAAAAAVKAGAEGAVRVALPVPQAVVADLRAMTGAGGTRAEAVAAVRVAALPLPMPEVATAAGPGIGAAAAAVGEATVPSGPARDPAVRSDQVAAVTVEPLLPFLTRPVRIGDDFFPEISALTPAAAVVAGGDDWLRPGVTIYSVDNSWVSDQRSIEEHLARAAGAADGAPVTLSLRIREDLGSPFRVVELTLPERRDVTLHAGFAVRIEPTGSGWRTSVTDAGQATGLQAGDVLMAEVTTGRAIDTATAFEEILAALAAETFAAARLRVLRAGEETELAVPLATGG